MGIYVKLGWFFKKYRNNYLIGIFFLLVVNVLQLIPPKLMGIFTDQVVDKKMTWNWLIWFLIALLVIYGVMYISRYIFWTHIVKGSALLERSLREQLFRHYLKMDAEFYQRHRTGDLMALSSNDLSAIQRAASGGVLMTFDSTTVVALTLGAMLLFTDWRLTLIAILPMPLIALGVMWIAPRLRKRFTTYQEQFSHMSEHAQESFLGIKVIKTLGQSKEDIEAFNKETFKQVNNNRKVAKMDALFDPLAWIVMSIVYFIVTVIGGRMVLERQMTVGELVTITGYVGNLVWPMFALGQLFNLLERANSSYDRVQEILHEKNNVVDNPDGLEITQSGTLKVDVETFSYPDDPKPVLKNVSFELPAGKSLGLVGSVGSGKSTILKLIMREFDDYKGDISYNGVDIKKYKMSSYLGIFGYVSQDNFLFSTSIAENIAFIDPKLPISDVIKASQTAALHNDIQEMPDQYLTQVGENGISLSGGQRQRLSIARALIVNPEILVLDDALSAVDAKTEKEILQALKEDRAGKTTIIAASRISSVLSADEILVFKDGQIIERGNHQSLLKEKGWYSKTFKQQELATKLDAKLSGKEDK
ncbi:MAG: ATP-binding cassette domain-containing protein [Lactobacillaceae bacterium]|nr:ATP-binding cassette domain-containing protein [Lactobacillaceae bacterium]